MESDPWPNYAELASVRCVVAREVPTQLAIWSAWREAAKELPVWQCFVIVEQPTPNQRTVYRHGAKGLPTFAELGYLEFTARVWFGLFVRTGTPPPIVETLLAAAPGTRESSPGLVSFT